MLNSEDIDRQLAELDMEEQSLLGGDMYAPVSHNVSDIDAQLKALEQEEKQLLSGMQQDFGYSYADRGAQFARGIGTGATGLIDLAENIHSGIKGARERAPYEDLLSGMNQKAGIPKPRQQSYEPLTPKFTNAFDKFYGKDLTPKDTTGKIIQGAGEFVSPLPGTGWAKAAKAGAPALGKLVGREAGKALGASSLVHGTPEIGEEGSGTRLATDLVKSLIGSKLGESPIQASKKLAGAILNPIETSKRTLAKGASKLISPDKEFLESAKKHEIEVPFNVASNSKTANFVANNYLKSMYTSKQYKDALAKADDSVVSAVKRSIDSLGEANLKPHEASAEYRNFLKSEEKEVKSQADKLYDIARKASKGTPEIIPSNTLKSLHSEPVKELLETISPSSAQKKVIERIKEISSNFEPGEKDLGKSFFKKYGNNKEFTEAALKGLKNKKTTDVGKLINLRSSLMQSLNYDPDIRGAEGFLSRIVKDLDKDISSVQNPEFLSKYRAANDFFKNNIADRFRRDIAKSIMSNKAPQDAFNLMNSVENVNLLEKIAGESDKGKELFNYLKKAKSKQILESTIQGDFDNGSIRGSSLSRIFQKGEKRQELLESLLGKKEYNNLSEIAKISEQFAKDGRELLNTSGTAHVLSDMNSAKNIAAEVSKTMAYMFGSAGAAYSAAGLPGAAASLAAPYVISKLLADEKFVNLARQYALARQVKNEKLADSILRKMVPMAQLAVKTQISQSKNQEKQ